MYVCYLYLKILKRQRSCTRQNKHQPKQNPETRRPNNSTIFHYSRLDFPRQTAQISAFPTSELVKIGGNARISARISVSIARTTEFTTRTGLSRLVVSVQLGRKCRKVSSSSKEYLFQELRELYQRALVQTGSTKVHRRLLCTRCSSLR